MSSISGLSSFQPTFDRLAIRTPRVSVTAKASAPTVPSRAEQIDDLRSVLRNLGKLRGSLDRLRGVLDDGKIRAGAGSPVIRSADLGLDLSTTAATATSTEELNTVATSFTPFGPAFTGASTSEATLGGTYDGTHGDDVLTFQARETVTVGGPRDIEFAVTGAISGDLGDAVIPALTLPDTPVAILDGLTLSLSAGTILQNDTFTVAVSSSIDSEVDPDQPFNGVRNENPNLEPGEAVGSGFFQVNGEVILVSASDTLNSVLGKINSSAAGVLASYDAATERVSLASTTAGSGGDVVVANDTSGFVSAAKLDTATTTPGYDNLELDLPLDQVSGLAGVASGWFEVNETRITIDREVDSLRDVMDRINQSEPTVDVTFDLADNQLEIRSNQSFTLEDGTSGLFGALSITPGTYDESATRQGYGRTTRRSSIELAQGIAQDFNEFRKSLADAEEVSSNAGLDAIVSGAIRRYFRGELDIDRADGASLETGFGLAFDLDDENGDYLAVDPEMLSDEIVARPGSFRELFIGHDSTAGLLGALDGALEHVENAVISRATSLNALGSLVDVIA